MKTIQKISIILIALCVTVVSAQEKKIKFKKGTLRICSAKNFKISGYEGDEVTIKSLSGKRGSSFGYVVDGKAKFPQARAIAQSSANKGKGSITYFFTDEEKKKGLKKLGKKNENRDLGIYFQIEQKDGELVFSDDVPSSTGQLVMYGNESYEIKIPNSLKLVWETNGCVTSNTNQTSSSFRPVFYNSKVSSLTGFNGEVDIKSNLSNIKLVDVTGPVSINTIGGNVTVEFDKKKPSKLYSIYSNNGYIDVTLPTSTDVTLDVTGESVYSDLEFKIESEKEVNDFGHIKTMMKLKQGSGKVKMKLDAGYGNIYLREKK